MRRGVVRDAGGLLISDWRGVVKGGELAPAFLDRARGRR